MGIVGVGVGIGGAAGRGVGVAVGMGADAKLKDLLSLQLTSFAGNTVKLSKALSIICLSSELEVPCTMKGIDPHSIRGSLLIKIFMISSISDLFILS